MKRLAIVAAILPLTFAGALAQGIYLGPGGVGVDTGDHGDHVIRKYQDDNGCMVRVIRHRRSDGDIVTRKIRDCD